MLARLTVCAACLLGSLAWVQQPQSMLTTPLPKTSGVPTPRLTRVLASMTPAERFLSTAFPEEHNIGGSIVDSLQSVETIAEPNEDEHFTTPLDYLRHLSCDAPLRAALAGEIVSAQSFPIDDGSYLFTAYDVRITEVFRLPPTSHLKIGDVVTVATPGGLFTVGGQTITAKSNWWASLDTGSVRLFFADYNAQFAVFHVHEPVFTISASEIVRATRDSGPIVMWGPLDHIRSRSSFEEVLRDASTCRPPSL